MRMYIVLANVEVMFGPKIKTPGQPIRRRANSQSLALCLTWRQAAANDHGTRLFKQGAGRAGNCQVAQVRALVGKIGSSAALHRRSVSHARYLSATPHRINYHAKVTNFIGRKQLNRVVTTRRPLRRRLTELAVLTLFFLNAVYSGRHDPDCHHHQIAQVAAGVRASQAAHHHSREKESRDDPADEQCRCGPICVAGSATQLVAAQRPASALFASQLVALSFTPAHSVYNARVPYLLPFATAPPKRLSI